MANRSVTVRLKAEIAGYLSAMRNAKSATDELGNATDKTSKQSESAFGRLSKMAAENEQAWSTVSTGLIGVGTAAVAGAGLAVKKFADFDKAMSSVQAATHASAGEMDSLRDAAVRTGADTAFSAEEAARGIEELAKAGVSTSDILGGGLDGALALAAAGGIEVGEAAETAASAMTQFGLAGGDVTHIADLLAAGAGKAQGGVSDLGQALNQTGLVANATGLSIEETVGTLSAFASAGMIGSDAGTSFKTMLQRLSAPTGEAAGLMEELGISAYDASGEFVGMSNLAGQMRTAMEDMTPAQRNAAMAVMFGADAVRAANIVYEQGQDGIQGWIDNVNDAGYAAETAALMQDNLAGDLEKLGGAMDTVFLKSGSGMNDALRGMVQGLEGMVDAVGKIPGPILTAGAAITGIVGVAALGAGAFMKVIPAVADTRQALSDLGITADGMKGKFGGLAKAAGVAAVAFAGFELAKWAGAQGQPAIDTLETLAQKITDAGTGAIDLDNAFDTMADGAVGSGMEIRNLDEAMNLKYGGGFKATMLSLGDGLGVDNEMARTTAAFEGFDDILSGMVESGNAEEAAAGFQQIADAAEAQGIPLEKVKADFPQYAAALETAAEASAGAAEGSEAVATGLEGVSEEAGEAAASLEDIVDALSMMGLITLDAQAATGAFHAALRDVADATEGMSGSISDMNGAFDTTTEAGYAAQQAFAEVATSGWDMAEANANAGASFGEIAANLQSTYDGLVATAEGFGFTAEQAQTLAREALGVPENVDIETWMSDSALAIATSTGQAAQDIPGEVAISSWMSDAAFIEAIRTRAAAEGIPEYEAIQSFMDSYAEGKANDTTAAVLGIPKGADIRSWMDANAENQAWRTKGAIDAIPREVNITTRHLEIWEKTSVGSPKSTGPLRPGLKNGGRVPSFADGGRLPATGLGTDKILGISSMTGQPTAWVDDREWVVNQRSSDKYNALIGAVNRDDPAVRHLAGYNSGGRVREYATGGQVTARANVSANVDPSGIEAAVATALSGWVPMVEVSDRQFFGVMKRAERNAKRP